MNPSNAELRQFIMGAFNDEELVTLCADYFPEVYQNYSDGMTKNRKVLGLISYCDTRGLRDNLVATLAKERPTAWQEIGAKSTEPVFQTRVHSKTGLEMIKIPAGEFLFSDTGIKIDLPAYWIGRTPVTYEQYSRFLRDKPDYIPKAGLVESDERLISSTFPITSVTWFEAIAFCNWASLRLPTQEEWEKAARGNSGRIFPWGNEQPASDRCNFNSNLNRVSLVGAFSPIGDSPFGCVDMAGNVWEWTSSEFESELGREWNTFFLKGGCYGSPIVEVRCAANVDVEPGSFGTILGFRVAADDRFPDFG